MLKQEAEAAREARALERAHAEAVLNLKVAQPGVQAQPQPDLLKTGLDIFEKVSPLLGIGFELLGGFDGIKEKATSAIQKMGAVSENSPLNRLMDILEGGVAIIAEKVIDSTPEENSDTPSREAIIEGEVV